MLSLAQVPVDVNLILVYRYTRIDTYASTVQVLYLLSTCFDQQTHHTKNGSSGTTERSPYLAVHNLQC